MMSRSKVDVERMKRKMLQYEEYSAVSPPGPAYTYPSGDMIEYVHD